MSRVMVAGAVLAGLLACSGATGPDPLPLQMGVEYYHDRDLQPGKGWDVDYAVWFEADGSFRMEDEGMCHGAWVANGDTITVALESRTDPDGNPGELEYCSGPTVFTVHSADLIVGDDTREFRPHPE